MYVHVHMQMPYCIVVDLMKASVLRPKRCFKLNPELVSVNLVTKLATRTSAHVDDKIDDPMAREHTKLCLCRFQIVHMNAFHCILGAANT